MSLDFIAVDVETANELIASICAVGLVRFRAGIATERWKTLIDPEDDFSDVNIGIHGIRSQDVVGAPTFTQTAEEIGAWLDGQTVVHHTHFDRTSIQWAWPENLRIPDCQWLDTARVARRAWSQFARKGYGLANIAAFLGIDFHHHDPGEDALVAGEILVAASKAYGFSLDDWMQRVQQPIDREAAQESRRVHEGQLRAEGNRDGVCYGAVLVFTGALSLPRAEATRRAAACGCAVERSVTKRTTMLVVGDQDIRQVAPGHKKSSKHEKAEVLIRKGQPIRILGESDFFRFLREAEE